MLQFIQPDIYLSNFRPSRRRGDLINLGWISEKYAVVENESRDDMCLNCHYPYELFKQQGNT